MTRALVLGQAPARTSREPLDGRAGRRLERLAGLGEGELPYVFALGNLLPAWPGNRPRPRPSPHEALGDEFDAARARESWASLDAEDAYGFDLVLLLGRHCAAAAGLRGQPFFRWRPRFDHPRRWGYAYGGLGRDVPGAVYQAAVLPHPSGASHFWNDPASVRRAERFLREVVAA